MSWGSYKSKRLFEFTGGAEMLAAVKAINKNKLLENAISVLLRVSVSLFVTVDFSEFLTSFSTFINSIDKSIRSDFKLYSLRIRNRTLQRDCLDPWHGEYC